MQSGDFFYFLIFHLETLSLCKNRICYRYNRTAFVISETVHVWYTLQLFTLNVHFHIWLACDNGL